MTTASWAMTEELRRAGIGESRRIFPVTLVHYVTGSLGSDGWPPQAEPQFEVAIPIKGQDQTFRFSVERVGDENSLRAVLRLRCLTGRPAYIVVVSDCLAAREGERWHPTTLVETVRECFRNGPHLAALVAVVGSAPCRIHDVDVTVSPGAGREALVSAVQNAAMALWLKAPPLQSTSKLQDDFRVAFEYISMG